MSKTHHIKIDEPVESTITIGGKLLNASQSMVIRVALSSFSFSLYEDGLGDDDHGKKMVKNYLNLVNEIQDMIFYKRGST